LLNNRSVHHEVVEAAEAVVVTVAIAVVAEAAVVVKP
jgi:hypothetical protein